MKSLYYLVNRLKLFQFVAQQHNRNTAVEKPGTITGEKREGICFPVGDLNAYVPANVF